MTSPLRPLGATPLFDELSVTLGRPGPELEQIATVSALPSRWTESPIFDQLATELPHPFG